jgi:GMP reductase
MGKGGMHIEDEVKLDFKDVLIRPKRSTLKSRSEVELSREFIFRNSQKKWSGVPIIAANMDTTGTFEMAKVFSKHKTLVALSKHIETEACKSFLTTNPECLPFVAISSGLSDSDFAKLKETMAATSAEMICLDVANGYSEHFVEYVAKVRAEFPDKIIIAGNVVTGEMTEQLILSGADIVKVGIGPGSVCTTRKQTGVGYPQLSAVIECADAAVRLSYEHQPIAPRVGCNLQLSGRSISLKFCDFQLPCRSMPPKLF